MENRKNARHTLQTLAVDVCEQLLEVTGGAGVRGPIPGTDKLIMVGTAGWIASNVKSADALFSTARLVNPAGTNGDGKVRDYLDRQAEAADRPFAWMAPDEIYGLLKAAADKPSEARVYGRVYAHQHTPDMVRVFATPAPVTAAQAEPVALPPLPEPLDIDWPELHSHALGCGVEDRGIRDRYEAAEYGWQDGVDKAAERVPEEIYTAEQMREYALAAIARLAAPAAAQAVRVPDLHDAIMRLPAKYKGDLNFERAYLLGHRDARHAAAELVSAAEAAAPAAPTAPAEQAISNFNIIIDPAVPPNTMILENGEQRMVIENVDFSAPSMSAAPTAKEGEKAMVPARWKEAAEYQSRVAEDRLRQIKLLQENERGHVWLWQGDGTDHIESMSSGMAVLIRADQLRTLATPSTTAAPAQAAVEEVDAADALNTILWLYRRLPRGYGRLPFVDATVYALARKTGTEVGDCLDERNQRPAGDSKGEQA